MNTTLLIKTAPCRLLLMAALLLTLGTPSLAQHDDSMHSDAYVSDFIKVYTTSADKIARLAGAVPADKYDWRPAEGVRSVKESVLHAASANYFFGSALGAEVPEDVNPQTMEQADMSKEEIIDALNASVTFMQQTLQNMEAAEFDTELDFFGSKVTKREVMFIVGDHVAEHLGQLIAYARMNGITPPWSQPQSQGN